MVSLSLTGLRKINREHTGKETKVKNDSVTWHVSADTENVHSHTSMYTHKYTNACTHAGRTEAALISYSRMNAFLLIIYLSVDKRKICSVVVKLEEIPQATNHLWFWCSFRPGAHVPQQFNTP